MLPASAAQAVVSGGLDFPANPELAEGRDIVRADVSYDPATGAVTSRIGLRGAPTPGGIVSTVLARRNAGGTCGFPTLTLIGASAGNTATGTWTRRSSVDQTIGSGGGVATVESANAVTLAITNGGFANLGYDCALVETGDQPAPGEVVVRDQVLVPVLAGPALPPEPPAPPVPPTPPVPPAPPAPPAPKAPKLAVSVSGVPSRAVRNRSYRVRIRVRNGGTATASNVRLSVPRVSGLRVSPTAASWKRLAAGKTGTRTVTVRLTGTRTRTATARATATGGLRATARLRMVSRTARKPARKPSTPKGPLVGQYFWGFKTQPDRAWDNYGVYFVDDRWAYYGLPPAGLPTCRAVTQVQDQNGKPTGEGCRRYTLNAKTGTLRVGDLAGSYQGGQLTLDKVDMRRLTIPSARARYTVDLEHKGFSGFCGYSTGCTTFAEYLALSADGKFVRSSRLTGSVGGVGAPFVWGSVFPADETGTYEILANGRIRFSYANGTVKVETIGIEQDRAGKPAAATEGLVIGDTNFYRPSV
ncbi:MAG: CARDB domain-containing protein [Patulibacter sp.]